MHSQLISLVFLSLSVLSVDAHAVADANPNLIVHVATPSIVPDAGGLFANTTVVNSGKQPVSILRHSGVFRPRTRNFVIANALGHTAAFNGMKVKWSPEAAVKSDNPSSILVLEPGERFTVHHNLAEVYDLSTLERNDKAQVTLAEAGAGFYIVNPESGEVAYTTATVVHEQPEIQVPSDVKFKTSHAAIQAPTPMAGCTPAETRAIQDTIPVTNRYISAARDYVPKNGGSGAGALYTKWFGKSSSANVQKVTTEFTNLMTNRFTGFTYNCHTAAPDCEEGDYAYVYARNYGIVYLCDEFFKAAVSGYDSKASTLVHEASHFIKNGGTVDVAYGVNASQNLAKMSPNRAVTNACNYEYFSVDADSATITSVEA